VLVSLACAVSSSEGEGVHVLKDSEGSPEVVALVQSWRLRSSEEE